MLLQFYKLVQGFRVTFLFTGQYKTKGLWHNYRCYMGLGPSKFMDLIWKKRTKYFVLSLVKLSLDLVFTVLKAQKFDPSLSNVQSGFVTLALW